MVRQPLADEALSQLFSDARTYNSWSDRTVDEFTIRRLYELAAAGPTAVNSNPARFVFITSAAGRERLRPHVNPGNLDKTMSAPCCVIIAYDSRFHDHLPQLFPSRDYKLLFEGKDELITELAGRNSTLQGAYLMLAARSLGMDCGPMSGFNRETLEEEFFPGGRWKANFLCNIGYGTDEGLHPRNPRLRFDQACLVI